MIDANGWPTDIGAYLSAIGDWAYVTNGLGTYRANLAGVTCGYSSALDPKSALTNKPLPNVSQIYQVTLAQLNELTAAKVNMLRFKGPGAAPALLHDYTCANSKSDFIFKLRMQIKFLVCSVLFQESDKFIGESTTDGLTVASLEDGPRQTDGGPPAAEVHRRLYAEHPLHGCGPPDRTVVPRLHLRPAG